MAAGICTRFRAGLAIVLSLGAATGGAAREKADVVRVLNGDRIACEIISLEAGRLQAKTSSLGTIHVDWKDVLSIESPYTFSIELVSGGWRVARFETSGTDGRTRIVDGSGMTELALADIARMGQEEAGFLDRIRGSVSLGFSHVHATDTSALSFDLDAEYRNGPKVTDITIDLGATRSPGRGTLDSAQIVLFRQWLHARNWFTFSTPVAERNEAQGIDLRLLVGGGLGRYLRRTSDSELMAFGGAAAASEWLADDERRNTAEALAGFRWRIYRFGDPETTVDYRLLLFPGLTDTHRFRARLDASLRHELIKDLFLGIGLYDSYESDPSGAAANENDYGVTFSIGYRF